MLKVIFLVEGELSFAFFCPFGYIPHPLDAPVKDQAIKILGVERVKIIESSKAIAGKS
jgi:hypothetical protein